MLGSSTLHPNGSSWTLKIPVGDIIIHPKYWGRNFIRSDIALLCLETPVTFNKYVQPICLPEHNFNFKVGTKCWVTGWGQVKQHSSGKLDGVGDAAPLGLYCPLPCDGYGCGLSSYGAPCQGSHGTAVRLVLLRLAGVTICLLEKRKT
jgi:hypothetical protein